MYLLHVTLVGILSKVGIIVLTLNNMLGIYITNSLYGSSSMRQSWCSHSDMTPTLVVFPLH